MYVLRAKKITHEFFKKKLLHSNYARISHNFIFKKIQLEVGQICSHQLFFHPLGDQFLKKKNYQFYQHNQNLLKNFALFDL